MQTNFILTDIMNTGYHTDISDFVSLNTMKNQTFDCVGQYYDLHLYNLDSYDRKFAMLDYRLDMQSMSKNKEFLIELDRRCKLLHSQGFKFIKATPWESRENIQQDEEKYSPKIEHDAIQWTGDVSWFWFYMYRKHLHANFEIDHTDKKYDFLYLNKQNRPHRQKLFNKLQEKKIIDNSLVTFHDHTPPLFLPQEYEINYPRRGRDQDINMKHYNDTKFSIVSETNDNDNDVFITEKIWKPIIAQQPFVVHGNYLYLQKLREMGFRTYSSHIDESYDLELDKNTRIEKIVSTCKQIKDSNWQDIYLQTQSLRQHNFNNFFNSIKLGEQIDKTLLLFLEFVDSSKISS